MTHPDIGNPESTFPHHTLARMEHEKKARELHEHAEEDEAPTNLDVLLRRIERAREEATAKKELLATTVKELSARLQKHAITRLPFDYGARRYTVRRAVLSDAQTSAGQVTFTVITADGSEDDVKDNDRILELAQWLLTPCGEGESTTATLEDEDVAG